MYRAVCDPSPLLAVGLGVVCRVFVWDDDLTVKASRRMPATPIAVFTYNRPRHTQRLLASLSACQRLDECHVVFFCDGAKTPEQAAAVQQTRQVVTQWAQEHGADVVLRDENYGLAKSIVTGVTALCAQYGRVIVLEDDLVLAPAFLEYMLAALDHYADDARVMQVSGYTFPFEDDPPPGLFLQPVATTWGWATWQRAWDHYEHDTQEAMTLLKNPQKSRSFDLNGAYPYTRMYRQAAAGKVDSWGVRWWFSIWRRGGLVVYSRQSMVANEGFDGSGVHSGGKLGWQMHSVKNAKFLRSFPTEMDRNLFRKHCQFIRHNFAPSRPPLHKRIWKAVRRAARDFASPGATA